MNYKDILHDVAEGKLDQQDVAQLLKYEQGVKAIRETAIKALLDTIPGEDSEREGLLATPDRVARMYDEIFGGYNMDASQFLSKTFAVDNAEASEEEIGDIYKNGIVTVKDIPFYSHCEHHMVPFIGKVWVAYIPKDRVVGLSKIARTVECFARRLQIQERMTTQIADAIVEAMDPLGVMVVIKAEHLCMSMRGVKKPGTNTITSAVRGVFTENAMAREECMNLFDLK